MGVPSGANSPPPCASKLCSPVPQYEFPVACEQALLFGRARTRERGVEERRACNDLSKIFISTPETPGLCKAWKLSPQTCRRLEKWQPPVKFRQPRARIIILKFIDRFCNSIKAIFLITDVFFFFPRGHRTSTCPLGWELNTLILVSFTFEKSSVLQQAKTKGNTVGWKKTFRKTKLIDNRPSWRPLRLCDKFGSQGDQIGAKNVFQPSKQTRGLVWFSPRKENIASQG